MRGLSTHRDYEKVELYEMMALCYNVSMFFMIDRNFFDKETL